MKLVVQNENVRIDKYISDVTDYSRELVTKMIKDKCILLNGSIFKPSH